MQKVLQKIRNSTISLNIRKKRNQLKLNAQKENERVRNDSAQKDKLQNKPKLIQHT